MKFKVSAILPVYNAENFVKKCLISVINQTYPVTEVLLIDDGSTDNTVKIAKNVSKKSKIPIKIFKKKRLGIKSKLINYAVRKTSSDIVWVLEADAYYHKDYLKNSIKHFKDEKVAGTIGRVHCWEVKTFLDRCREIELALRYKKYRAYTVWVIRRSFLDEVGGFDERVRFHDDIILGKEFKKRGYKLVFEPKAKWYHDEKTSLQAIAKQRLKWGYGFSNLFVYYRWMPTYIYLWTLTFSLFFFSLLYGFTDKLLLLFFFILILYAFKIGVGAWKITKNPAYWFAIPLIKLYRSSITTMVFWLGLLLRLLHVRIL